MDRSDLISNLKKYTSSFPEEVSFVERFLNLLEHPRCYHRDHLPGHITGSSWIVNDNATKTLLVHHVKLNKWLQPGGHADGDENVVGVARREAVEETGITTLHLVSDGIFDIDIHTIPARKEMPEHYHYDVRFLFRASDTLSPTVSPESNDVKWIALQDLERFSNEGSILRMKKKSLLNLL